MSLTFQTQDGSLIMGPPTDRKQILEGFRKQIEDGKPIVGAGAGLSLELGFLDTLADRSVQVLD